MLPVIAAPSHVQPTVSQCYQSFIAKNHSLSNSHLELPVIYGQQFYSCYQSCKVIMLQLLISSTFVQLLPITNYSQIFIQHSVNNRFQPFIAATSYSYSLQSFTVNSYLQLPVMFGQLSIIAATKHFQLTVMYIFQPFLCSCFQSFKIVSNL